MLKNNKNSLRITTNILGGLDYFVSKQAASIVLLELKITAYTSS